MDIITLTSKEDWESFISLNKNNEKIIFKFSSICPVSFFVEKKIASWINDLDENQQINIAKVDVVNSKSLSELIEEQTNVKHESPQVIWLDKNNDVKWNASHYSISKGKLEEQLTGEKVNFLRKIF
ncbi:MAG: bacillithiol system redox-active protein YtxJ [Ignavibacteriales bacterium CG12_big_fil_rev_8_21_14_0_65_30_8]|nr:MAG: bacillithiol system redox-active protein YtxJ [Ignavibacteriales bacterium CG12_big_fil_rev_8_21_14_0_65_30_8]